MPRTWLVAATLMHAAGEEKETAYMADNTINVEEIMAQIRENIKASGADKIPLSFTDGAGAGAMNPQAATGAASVGSDGSRLGDAVSYLSYNYEVQPYQLLTGNPVKVFIKKCFRKVGSFFFLPIVGQQNTLNFHFFIVSEAVKEERREIDELKRAVEALEADVAALKNKGGDKA